MAINFLDNIQLNQNQLLGARLENVTSDPGTANGGDIIFNSTSKKLKYYNETAWISLPDGIGIGGFGTVDTIPMFKGNSTSIGDSIIQQNAAANQVKVGGNFWATGSLLDSGGSAGTSGQLLSSTGSLTDWIDAPVSYTKWIADGVNNTPQNVNDGDTYELIESTTNPGVLGLSTTKAGTKISQPLGLLTKNMATVTPSTFATDVLLWGQDTNGTDFKVNKTQFTDVSISTWDTATADIVMDGFKITELGAPTGNGDAANKAYVDSAVTGGLTVKGGFNANTGITAVAGTNLYTNTTLEKGDFYVVTVAGNFFSNAATPLTVGDSVLVQTAAASGTAVEGDFAIIQSDTDLATASTVGLGNVNVNGTGNLDGLNLSYSSGTATLGVDIKNNAATFTALAEMAFLVYDGNNTGTNLSLPIESIATFVSAKNSFAATSSSGTTHTFTHSLGTDDVIVQIFDASTKETVYADVDRTSTNVVTVTTAASANIRCLIQKIG